MSVWALVLAGVLNSQPVAIIQAGYQTEAECRAAQQKHEAVLFEDLSKGVIAIGVGCVEVKAVPGKPV